jgi:hypothetical protein
MEQKIDKRKKYMLVIDTETCPLDRELEKVDARNMWVYDVGFAVVDKKGTVYETKSFVNADIFLDEKELMKSSYYANKIPNYWKDIKSGKRTLTSFYKIRKSVADTIEKYSIKEVYAHNMYFDYTSLNNTQRWLTKSKYRQFFPYGVTVCDTLKMARQVIGNMVSYQRFVTENNLLSATGRISFTAENIYKFITKDLDFVESHTGLEDVLIEKEILAYCYKQHKKMNRCLFNN